MEKLIFRSLYLMVEVCGGTVPKSHLGQCLIYYSSHMAKSGPQCVAGSGDHLHVWAYPSVSSSEIYLIQLVLFC